LIWTVGEADVRHVQPLNIDLTAGAGRHGLLRHIRLFAVLMSLMRDELVEEP